MGNKTKHAQRSKRSSHNLLPVGMFAMKGRLKQITKGMKIDSQTEDKKEKGV